MQDKDDDGLENSEECQNMKGWSGEVVQRLVIYDC